MSLPSPTGSSKTAGKWLAVINTAEVIRLQYKNLGPPTATEKKAAVVLAVTLVLLSTDSLHHIDPGWLLLLVAAVLFLPGVNLMNKDKFRKIDFMDQYIFPYQYGVLMLAFSYGYMSWPLMVRVFAAKMALTPLFLLTVAQAYWRWLGLLP